MRKTTELEKIEAEIRSHRRNVFNEVTGDWHTSEINRLKQHPVMRAENQRHREHSEWLESQALLRLWQ